jgi:ketosteroid isomerase-like protein
MNRSQQRASSVVRALAACCIGTASLLAAIPAIGHEPDAEEIALGSLVDAEFAFARMASLQGVRAAFLANFAADGVALEPAPLRVQQAWRSRPAPADLHAIRLEWKPAQAGVARSHDFGYTTGPFTVRTASHPEREIHGAFFSVWQRGSHGKWQVVLDAGISSPEAVDFVALGESPRPTFAGRADLKKARRDLLALEARGGSRSLAPNDYAKLLADDARLQRNGAPPLASRGAIARTVALRTQRIEWTPIDARIAKSADMAVTWGRYRETGRDASTRDGYYAHLWLRDRAGEWRVAYDVALPENGNSGS